MSEKKTKFDASVVRELAVILREADLGEIEIEHADIRVRVSRASSNAPPQVVMSAPAPQTVVPSAPPAQTPPSPEPVSPSTQAEIPSNAVTSPMVGTVYLRPEPGADAYVEIGKQISKGDTLMLIEAMKTFNPVESSVSGTIKAVYVEDEQPVEFGEALVLIE